jgi:hypothetical protein
VALAQIAWIQVHSAAVGEVDSALAMLFGVQRSVELESIGAEGWEVVVDVGVEIAVLISVQGIVVDVGVGIAVQILVRQIGEQVG